MAAEQSDPLAPHPERDVVLDTAALRVLAHPMRLSFLHYLRDHGPATGRRLAAHFGLDSGAVSYHLRKLEAGGLIEEDAERGTRRDRWWRVVRQALYHDPAAVDGDLGEQDSRAYLHATLLAYGDALRRYTAEVPHLGKAWLDVTMTSERSLWLSPDQLTELKRDLVAVIDRYRDLPEQPDARLVSLHIHALPPPEQPARQLPEQLSSQSAEHPPEHRRSHPTRQLPNQPPNQPPNHRPTQPPEDLPGR